ncbi:MAG: hypothetical protein D6754_05020 [Alphaproteobacteria bacterium]|nr:MAG: hypothetical protein D6754_05020 [Alphaproteobacteria bacterium]
MLERIGLEGLGWRQRVHRLIGLLAEERAALRRARLEELARIAPRRMALLESLAAMEPPAGEDSAALLERLQREAGRNQRLIGAFLDGLRAAARQIAQIENATGRIGLYDPHGAILPETPGRPLSDRRA